MHTKTWLGSTLGFVVGLAVIACAEKSGSGTASEAVDERSGDSPAADGGSGPTPAVPEGENPEPTTPAGPARERDAGLAGSEPAPIESNGENIESNGENPVDAGVVLDSGADCSGETGDAAAACALTLIPEGCQFLAARAAEPKCHFAAACEQVRNENVPRYYTLVLDNEQVQGEPQDATQRVECLERWVSEFTPGPVEAHPDWHGVTLFATWDQAAVLTLTAALHSVDLGCPASGTDLGSCDYCWELDQDACASDAFCSETTGARVNEEAACVEAQEFLSCRPQFSCGDIGPGYFRAPDGACYLIGGMEGECQLAGYEFDSSCEAVFELAEVDADRPCAESTLEATDAGLTDAGPSP